MSASGEGGGVLEADATRDHAALLASIVEFSDDAILAKGLDGRILSWNRGAERLFGYSAAEMLGESILRLVPSELHGDEEYIVAQLRSGQSIHHFETERLHRSGRRIAVSLTVSPIRDKEGRVVGASKTLRDISERKRIEAALKASEERYALALQGMSVGVWDWDIATGRQEWSERMRQMLGVGHEFSPEYVASQSYVHPEDLGRVTRAIEAHLKERKRYDIEFRFLHPEGRPVWVRSTGQAIWDVEGRPLRMVGSIDEITDRKRAESALKASEERYALAVEGMSVGLWDWNVETGELWWSPLLKRILGIEDAAFEPNFSGLAPWIHPEDLDRMHWKLQAHLELSIPYDLEFRMVRADGKTIWIHATGQAAWDAAGKPVRMAGSLADISERKLAEEKFRRVVEAAPVAILTVGEDGVIAVVNRQMERMFGYRREEMLGQRIEFLIPERFRAAHPGQRQKFFARPAMVDPVERSMAAGRDLFGLRKDGSEFPLEIGLTPIETNEGTMVLAAATDITARREVEKKNRELNRILEERVLERTAQLEAANRELDAFAYAASHDLKAPLRVIYNASKWLEEDLAPHLTGEIRENMNLLRGRVSRMDRLLDDLLEYSRIGRRTDNRFGEAIGGGELMENILGLLAVPEGFSVDVDSSLAAISVYRMPLQQILLNLISNAIKHHDKQTGRVQVSVATADDAYVFSVQDDGPGIPAQFHEQIFEMFQTLKPRDQVEGSGMGLAMVRKQIEISGGRLRLESEVGKGSKFLFSWPRKSRAGDPAEAGA